jgi:hypothetical protein
MASREEFKAEVDAAVDEFQRLILEREGESTGIPKPPTIEEDLVELAGVPFDFGLEDRPRAEAFPGEGPPPPPPPTPGVSGACCLCAGNCLVVSADRCTELEGIFQGVDTICADFVCDHRGACCTDGVCTVEDIDTCAGEYQGDCTTCVEGLCEEPTGACCDAEGVCVEATEAECTGTYQGDGTVCDPNPCLPTCSCGFSAYDGSGRRFLTQTYVREGVFTQARTSDPPCANITMDATVNVNNETTYDPLTCTTTVTATASSTLETTGFGIDTHCSQSNTSCWDSNLGGLGTGVLFCSSCAGGDYAYSDTGEIIDSATSKHRSETATGPSCSDGHNNENWELSDECTPI